MPDILIAEATSTPVFPFVFPVFAIATVWSIAIILLGLNHSLIRLLEGYPFLPLLSLLECHLPATGFWIRKTMHARFEAVTPTIELQHQIDMARRIGGLCPELRDADRHARLLRDYAEFLPPTRQLVLPTRLGNVFRAFESYSYVLYGLDAIPSWSRIQPLLSQNLKEMLSNSKANLDFCINMFVCSFTAVFVSLFLFFMDYEVQNFFICVVSIIFSKIFYEMAIVAASQFGNYVKAAFDLHRRDLAQSLGLDFPNDICEERRMWNAVSRMMIYRSAARAEDVSQYYSK